MISRTRTSTSATYGVWWFIPRKDQGRGLSIKGAISFRDQLDILYRFQIQFQILSRANFALSSHGNGLIIVANKVTCRYTRFTLVELFRMRIHWQI